MNICVLAHTIYHCDPRVRRETECLAEIGAVIDVFCLREKDEKRFEVSGNIRIHRLFKFRKPKSAVTYFLHVIFFSIISFFYISFYQLKNRFDFVHVHSIPDFLVFAALVPKLFGATIVFDMHENMPELYMRKFDAAENSFIIRLIAYVEKLATMLADHVIVATPFIAEKIVQRSCSKDKITTIINLPDTKHFMNHSLPALERNGKFRLIYPGTLSELHGIDIAIRAIKLIKDQSDIPVEFHIYGTGSEKENLISLTQTLHLEDSVKFCREVSIEKLVQILRSMDVGVVPKRKGVFSDEAISTKLFEFAAVGLPTIVSRTRGDS
ncbi:glycosyltransferase, partial [candidate division KSB1 bacterium]